jgi:hypothetical protein
MGTQRNTDLDHITFGPIWRILMKNLEKLQTDSVKKARLFKLTKDIYKQGL